MFKGSTIPVNAETLTCIGSWVSHSVFSIGLLFYRMKISAPGYLKTLLLTTQITAVLRKESLAAGPEITR